MNNLLNNIIQLSNNTSQTYRTRPNYELYNTRYQIRPLSRTIQNNTTILNNNIQNEILYDEPIYDNISYDDASFNDNNTNIISAEPIFTATLVQNQRFIDELSQNENMDLIVNSNNDDEDLLYQEITRTIALLQSEYINHNDILQQSMNDTGGHCENNDDEISIIKTKIKYDIYKNIKNELKNDICPISLCNLCDDDEVIIINHCKHCISKDYEESFLKNCSKCPLCNYQLL
jgi:hypothetical protein